MGQTGSWIWKSLGISAALALAAWVSFYFFFKIHQELNIQPDFAWRLGLLVFLVGTIVAMIYFRLRR